VVRRLNFELRKKKREKALLASRIEVNGETIRALKAA
jgi:hypothetical protein